MRKAAGRSFARRRIGPLAIALLAAMVAVAAVLPRGASAASNHQTAPDFTLSDQNGHPFTLSHYRGKPVVLFFGYTHCPDVCPTILANLKHARSVVGPGGSDVLVALITVDPSRDTAAALRDFVSVFDPSFLGLRGSDAQLEPVYRAYHVRLAKQAANASGYLVSHTAFVYYIGRDGRVRGFGTWSDPQDVLQENLREIVSSRP
jgi:protein SCO1/2